MDNPINQNICDFFDYHDKLRNSIINAEFDYQSEVNRMVLLFVLIDSLSVSISPEENNVRERFKSFIKKFSDWGNNERYSLVQIYYAIKEGKIEISEDLFVYIEKKIKSKIRGQVFNPDFDEVLNSPNLIKNNLSKIDKYSYLELLWRFRNYLIHEFRIPGRGWNISDGDEIYYLSVSVDDDIERGEYTWELIFPIQYINLLVKNSIFNAKKYCLEKELDPSKSFDYNTLWT